ncbi:SRPBCC family protein [Limobrevibacterium gyesilva]|uniref:SRPBCC family protein n=1 Tax=Limobrevibacterium gyesilva TaxID=2991712 RepID=UPI002227E1B8
MISRTFAAPRALVFKAWSSAEHMKRWFSPEGYTVPAAEIDFRPGGVCAICMRSPEGQDIWSKGVYIEISPPDRLVFTSGVAIGDSPKFTARTTVTFEDDGAGTRMTVHQAYDIHDESFLAAVAGAPEGWRTTLDKLEQEVARIQAPERRSVVHASFSLERTYDAAPAVVFHALSDRAAKARWFEGGDGYALLEREMDVRPGGRERVSGRWTSGTVSTFDAVYYDVVPNERLVYAYEMHLDDRKISVSLATVELTPAGTGTRLVVTEQGAFLDGYDDAGSREHGTGFLLDRLGASLQG